MAAVWHDPQLVRILIVGAGPAGASLALMLARRGAEVILLERHRDFSREFRGEGLMPSGSRVIQQLGLATELEALPQTRVRQVELFLDRVRVLSRPAEQLFGAIEPLRMISQPALLELLVSKAASAGCVVRRGTAFKQLIFEGSRIAGVIAESREEPIQLRADLVIGTDGRQSHVRHRADLGFIGTPQAFDVVWCKVELPSDWPEGTVRFYLASNHLLIAFPAHDQRLQLGWVIAKRAFGELRARGIPEWITQIAQHVDADLARHLEQQRERGIEPHLLDVQCDRAVTWHRPGLLLLGDAAHPMSPVGAQGINIALRDAVVAAQRLGPWCGVAGEPAAIDRACEQIERERLREVIPIQRQQALPPRLVMRSDLTGAVLRSLIRPVLRLGWADPLIRRALRRFANGITEVTLG
jgi:2-polyprenyl-6-methoxyphenol hydroxylase-like FAD-dependent oxidoreductase